MHDSALPPTLEPMNEAEKRYLIGLNMIPEITPRRMGILLSRFPSPRAIWKAPMGVLAALPGFDAVAPRISAARDEATIDRELTRVQAINARIITVFDSDYPAHLREIDDPPVVLYALGAGTIDTRTTIAVVGTRRASGYGKAMAHKLAAELARHGITVVSGLAVGIDTAAHRGALSGDGMTVAVIGSGLGRLYPTENARLARKIVDSGGIIMSEFPVDARPTKWSFPQRNRIISGLSRGVVVVEAPEKSGALITARLALEQGREVFAVPGQVTSAVSRGTNRLIQDGARLVVNVVDILSEFPDLANRVQSAPATPDRILSLTPVQQHVYDLIGLEPTHIDDIIARGDVSPTKAAHTLLILQMENLIQEVEGRRYIRRP